MWAAVAIAAAAGMVLGWLVLAPWLRQRRRGVLLRAPLAARDRASVARDVPLVTRLPDALRTRLDGLINAFVAEKNFVGCDGLVIDDRIRSTIAALASVLVLGRRGHYEELQSILVYPGAFWVEDEVEDEDGIVTRRRRVLSGESWDASRIILSWEDVTLSSTQSDETYNVALHEFAHYLDAEGLGLAASNRPAASAVQDWAEELADEFDALLAQLERGEHTLLDPYAAEDEAEFFAVATEEFLERPQALLEAHPRLYALLQEFYGLEPAAWDA